MEDLFLIVLVAIGFFGWGMYAQEMIQKIGLIRARESRIVIDAPFSHEQSETIMNALKEIHESINASITKEQSIKEADHEY